MRATRAALPLIRRSHYHSPPLQRPHTPLIFHSRAFATSNDKSSSKPKVSEKAAMSDRSYHTTNNSSDNAVNTVYESYGQAASDPTGRTPARVVPGPEREEKSAQLHRPTPKNSVFFMCDIQETFRDKMHQWPLLVAAATFLTKVAASMKIPVIVTEQKPFKPTISELSAIVDSQCEVKGYYSKTLFSMLTPTVLSELRANHSGVRHIYLYGIESHVCVLQTTLDLLRHGYIVHLPMDAVTSMHAIDRELAIERYRGLAAEGVVLTSAESVAFELAVDASDSLFKPLVPIIKEYAAAKKVAAESKRSSL